MLTWREKQLKNEGLFISILLLSTFISNSLPLNLINDVYAQTSYNFEISAIPQELVLGSSIRVEGKICPSPSTDSGTGIRTYYHITRPDGSMINDFSTISHNDYCKEMSTMSYFKPDMIGVWSVDTVAKWSSGGSIQQLESNAVNFEVKEEGFTLRSITALDVYQGESRQLAVSVDTSSQSKYAVGLSISDPPEGISYSFNPQSGNPPFTSTLTLITHSNAPVGEYKIILTGSSNNYSSNTKFTLNIHEKNQLPEPQQQSLTLSKTFVSPSHVLAGGSFSGFYVINNPNSFTVPVRLGLSIRPSGTDSEVVDNINDIVVLALPGVNTYSRSFKVPTSASGGSYDVALDIWSGTLEPPVQLSFTGWQTGILVVIGSEIPYSPVPQIASAGIKSVGITSSSISSTSVKPNQTLTFYYKLSNPSSQTFTVWLDASIRDSSGEIIKDPTNYIAVSVTPDVDTYSREFTIPSSAPSGSYDYMLSLWNTEPPHGNQLYRTNWYKDGFTVSAMKPEFTESAKKPGFTESKHPGIVSVEVDSEQINLGDKVTISGSLSPASLSSSIKLIFIGPNMVERDETITSKSDGSFSFLFSPDLLGTWSVSASWEGDDKFTGSVSSPVTWVVEATEVKFRGILIDEPIASNPAAHLGGKTYNVRIDQILSDPVGSLVAGNRIKVKEQWTDSTDFNPKIDSVNKGDQVEIFGAYISDKASVLIPAKEPPNIYYLIKLEPEVQMKPTQKPLKVPETIITNTFEPITDTVELDKGEVKSYTLSTSKALIVKVAGPKDWSFVKNSYEIKVYREGKIFETRYLDLSSINPVGDPAKIEVILPKESSEYRIDIVCKDVGRFLLWSNKKEVNITIFSSPYTTKSASNLYSDYDGAKNAWAKGFTYHDELLSWFMEEQTNEAEMKSVGLPVLNSAAKLMFNAPGSELPTKIIDMLRIPGQWSQIWHDYYQYTQVDHDLTEYSTSVKELEAFYAKSGCSESSGVGSDFIITQLGCRAFLYHKIENALAQENYTEAKHYMELENEFANLSAFKNFSAWISTYKLPESNLYYHLFQQTKSIIMQDIATV